MNKIVVFAGSGSNAENIIKHFKNNNLSTVSHVFCNNSNAYVIDRVKNLTSQYTFLTEKVLKKKMGYIKSY